MFTHIASCGRTGVNVGGHSSILHSSNRCLRRRLWDCRGNVALRCWCQKLVVERPESGPQSIYIYIYMYSYGIFVGTVMMYRMYNPLRNADVEPYKCHVHGVYLRVTLQVLLGQQHWHCSQHRNVQAWQFTMLPSVHVGTVGSGRCLAIGCDDLNSDVVVENHLEDGESVRKKSK